MTSSGSVAGRAVLALMLMVGFYALALLIAGVLLYLPYAELVYAHRLHPKLALICLAGAGSIVWSVLPRIDRFMPPGPQLEGSAHPKLFAELDSVAQATGQAMPSEVYLIGDVNAWVAQRGGVMGFSSRRVMGLGLPLLQALTLSEFRAVLAHEFGHYHGGDTRLGPWVYKTRAAIGRTLASLSGSLLQKPFLWYGELFLRVSHAVSRRQEFSADALASRVVGARPLVSGLKKLQGTAVAYDAYWSQELQPVLQAGFVAPIADGFRQFAGEKKIVEAMSEVLARELREGTTDPYDTHPALADRVAAVEGLPPGPDPAGEPAAISLLCNVTELEREWLGFVVDPAKAEMLQHVDWEAVPAAVLIPAWENEIAKSGFVLGDATLADLTSVIAESQVRAARLPQFGNSDEELEKRVHFLHWLAGVALALALHREGWEIESAPGSPVRVRRGGVAWNPLEMVKKIADGSLSAEEWRAMVEQQGLNPKRLLK